MKKYFHILKFKILNQVAYWLTGEKIIDSYICKKLFIRIIMNSPQECDVVDLSRYESHQVAALDIYLDVSSEEVETIEYNGYMTTNREPIIIDNALLIKMKSKQGDYWTWRELFYEDNK